MAIVQNPITGRTHGKVGGVVFSKNFGKNTMRSKPIEVKNPRTEGQVNQRNKFSLAVALGRSILGTLRYGFQQMAVGMSAFNSFISYTVNNAIDTTGTPYVVDYTKLKVSDGTLEGIVGITATAESPNKITLGWTDNSGQGDALATDKSAYVFLNKTKNEELTSNSGAERSAATQSITVPDTWVDDEVECYMFFGTIKGDIVCDSEYAGMVTVIA